MLIVAIRPAAERDGCSADPALIGSSATERPDRRFGGPSAMRARKSSRLPPARRRARRA
jgi:hypothetical protein